jgi:hypothetical protein
MQPAPDAAPSDAALTDADTEPSDTEPADAEPSDAGPTGPDTQQSAFGLFAPFTPEFRDYERAAGLSHPEYLQWVGDECNALGAHWTRSNLQLLWDLAEPQLGDGYNWDNAMATQPTFAAAARAGVHYLGVFHAGGLGRTRDGAVPPRNPLDDPAAYQAFVTAAVERYDGDGIDDAPQGGPIRHWQVGNESPGFTQREGGIDDYLAWYTLTAEAVHRADPTAEMVLIGSVNAEAMDPLHAVIIPQLAAAEIPLAAVDLHHWGRAEQVSMRAVPEYRRLLAAHGLEHVELWSGEHGTYVGQITSPPATCTPACRESQVCAPIGPNPRCVNPCQADTDCPQQAPACVLSTGLCGPPAQSEQDQARSLIKRYVINRDLGVTRILWNNLVAWHCFGGTCGGQFDRMGLVSGGFLDHETPADLGRRRLAWYSYRDLAAKTDAMHAERLGPIEGLPDGVYVSAYRSHHDGTAGFVAWADAPTTIELPLPTAQAQVVSLISDADGAPLHDALVDVVDGRLSVALHVDPVWIEPAQ